MAEVVDTISSLYKFRFGTSGEVVYLNQKQLDLIPYLATLVANKDNFLSSQNENDEYVLNYPIKNTLFIPILSSVTHGQPYTLVNELPKDEDLLDALRLCDYLGIKSFPLPLLKNEHLILSNPVNIEETDKRITYHSANLSEARQTAAEFIIALIKNEYNLNDSYTVQRVFSLIEVILSNTAVFSSRFRHHTLKITKNHCYSFFSKAQRHLLHSIHRMIQNGRIITLIYLLDDRKYPPNNFQNAFAWKGTYILKKDKPPTDKFQNINTEQDDHMLFHDELLNDDIWQDFISISDDEYPFIEYDFSDSFLIDMTEVPANVAEFIPHRPRLLDFLIFLLNKESENDSKKKEAQLARSGHFNTLPKRPIVDKFKHRSGPKAQKYR